MVAVVALIHGKKGNYGISFPDFLGCISGGDTMTEAVERGREALTLHIESMAEDGDALPAIREVDAIRADKSLKAELADVAALAVVEVELPGRSTRVNITMDERLVERIDRKAKTLGETRSGFLAQAAKERLAS